MTSFLSRRTTLGKWFVTGCLLAAAVTAGAVERKLTIEAPSKVGAHADFSVLITASTDAGAGEHVGFFQVESSLDDGKTWTAVAYLDKLGAVVKRPILIKSGAAGTNTQVRVRVAFRDGAAKDVDYTGAAIRWADTWEKWGQPPAKSATIKVTES